MTGRDRIVIVLVAVAVVLAGAWMEVVSPERKQAGEIATKVTAAQSALQTAEGQVAHGRQAQAQYSQAYAAMVNLGKAVPPSQEVPALIYQLTQASQEKSVNFSSIANSASATTSTTATATSASGGFTDLPFTFGFEGNYFNLEHLFHQLTSFATLNGNGDIAVSGRLLTISSVNLTPASAEGSSKTTKLTGTIGASAYVLPAGESVTGSTGASSATSTASPASSSAPATSPTSPAVVKVNP